MPPRDPFTLPFITRDQLEFASGSTFGLQIVTQSRFASPFTIRVATRTGILNFTVDCDGLVAPQTREIQIPDIPLWISANDPSSNFGRGELFVSIALTVNADPVYDLASGYVYAYSSLSWPTVANSPAEPTAGSLITVDIPQPAAGAELTYTFGNYDIVKVRGLRFLLTDAAAAATRTVHIKFLSNGTLAFEAISGTNQIISEAKTYDCFAKNAGGPATVDNHIYVPIPDDLLLDRSAQILTATTALNAADQFSAAVLYVERWIGRY